MEAFGLTPAYLTALLLASVRITALLVTAPVVSGRAFPGPAKAGLGLLIAFVLLPASAPFPTVPSREGEYLVAVGQEVLVGALAGFSATVVFTAARVAGELAGVQIGMGLQMVADPMTGQRSSSMEQLYGTLAALVFLTLNGHHQLLLGLNQLFQVVPVGGFVANPLMVDALIDLSANMFMVAVRVALPVMGTLLLVDAAMALVARVSPQMNIFFVGMPLKSGLAFLIVVLTLPVLAMQLEQLVNGVARDAQAVLGRGGF